MRYHLKSVTLPIAAGATAFFEFGPESYDCVCENIALWMNSSATFTWTVRYNGVPAALAQPGGVQPIGTYNVATVSRVWWEPGPLPTSLFYPSVAVRNPGATDASITITWTALIRQIGG